MTYPYRPDTEAIIRGPHRQDFTAWAYQPGDSTRYLLNVESISVAWDEERAPRVTADLECRCPDTQAVLDVLDPRKGPRIQIDAGYVRPGGGRDVYPFVDLGLRERSVSRPADTITLRAASDEALVIDAAATFTQTVTASNPGAAIQVLVNEAITPSPLFNVVDAGSAPVSLDKVTDRWSTIRDLADRAALAVYDAGQRAWVIEARPTAVGASQAVLIVGAGGTLERTDSAYSRDGWFNYVAYEYKWRDAANVDQIVRATAYVDSGPYRIDGAAGRKIYHEERDTPTDQASANASAAALVTRHISRGRKSRLIATSALWLRPGMTVTIQYQLGGQERHLVSRVSFNLADGSMDVDTREPVTDFTVTTTTAGGTPTPDPKPPPAATYRTAWPASDRASYQQGGAKRAGITDLYQGYNDPTNGNQQGLAVFAAGNSYGSEVNRTLAQALSAATITKVEVWFTANAWYYPNPTGGTGRIGVRATSTIPATFTGAVGGVDVPKWQAGEARWVDVTALVDIIALKAGNFAVTTGPGNGTDSRFYGNFSGSPSVRVTYVR